MRGQRKPKTLKYQKSLPLQVEATGNPFVVDPENPATVPIPNSVIITKIEGPYTEKDRKLWVLLVHAVWDRLLEDRIHELPVEKINRIFREVGGDSGVKWLWDSARRLSKTNVEFEFDEDGERMQGVSNLLNAVTTKSAKDTGRLKFEVPALLSQVIRAPYRFSRLRLHFMIGLSGKYAVTLYELLEGVANLKNPVLNVSIEQLRAWLKIPDGKMTKYFDFRRFVIDPAIKQINDNPTGAGFSVDVEAIKEGRSYVSIRFTVNKTQGRVLHEGRMKPAALPVAEKDVTPADSPKAQGEMVLKTFAYENAKKAAPGYDIYALEADWREWMVKTGKDWPDAPEAAFIGFCRRKAKEMPLD